MDVCCVHWWVVWVLCWEMDAGNEVRFGRLNTIKFHYFLNIVSLIVVVFTPSLLLFFFF